MDIPNGTALRWSGTWTPSTGEWISGGSVNDITSELSAMGFRVKAINVTNSNILGQIANLGPSPVQGVIDVETSGGFDYPDADNETGEQNVADAIATGVQIATGNSVTGSLSNIVLPVGSHAGGPSSVPTQVAQAGTVKPACGSGFSGTLGSFFGTCAKAAATQSPSSTDFLSSLTSKGTMYIALAVFGFIAALALIGYSGALKRT